MFALATSFFSVMAAVLGALASIVGVLGFFNVRWNRARKGIAYSLWARQVARNSDHARARIVLDGHAVGAASLVSVSFRNTGNRTIRKEDFDGPFLIQFPVGSVMLDEPTLGERDPKTLTPLLSDTGTGVTVEPLILNGGDRFEVSFLIKGTADQEPTVSVRIAEVKRLILEPAPKSKTREAEREAPAEERAAKSSAKLKGTLEAGALTLVVLGALTLVVLACSAPGQLARPHRPRRPSKRRSRDRGDTTIATL
jgi:hypothetical protein